MRTRISGGAQVTVIYPNAVERDLGALTAREIQLLRLVTLAVEPDVLKRSTMLALNRHDVPALYTAVGSTRLKIKAEQVDGRWLYTWGRGESCRTEATRRGARHIAAMVTA